MKNDQLIFLVTQKDAAENDPDITKCYSTGVVAKIVQVIKQPDNSTRVVIEGKFRAGIVTPVFLRIALWLKSSLILIKIQAYFRTVRLNASCKT